MVETVTCAKCGGRVPLDVNHGDVTVEIVQTDDRNKREDYALCMECANQLVGEWKEPL